MAVSRLSRLHHIHHYLEPLDGCVSTIKATSCPSLSGATRWLCLDYQGYTTSIIIWSYSMAVSRLSRLHHVHHYLELLDGCVSTIKATPRPSLSGATRWLCLDYQGYSTSIIIWSYSMAVSRLSRLLHVHHYLELLDGCVLTIKALHVTPRPSLSGATRWLCLDYQGYSTSIIIWSYSMAVSRLSWLHHVHHYLELLDGCVLTIKATPRPSLSGATRWLCLDYQGYTTSIIIWSYSMAVS